MSNNASSAHKQGSRPVSSGLRFPDIDEVRDRLLKTEQYFSHEGCPKRRDCFGKQSIRFVEKFENELLKTTELSWMI
jgi:hypothetical protein